MLKAIACYHKYQKKWGGITELVLSRSPQVTSLCVTKANTSLISPGVQKTLSAHRTLHNHAGNVCSLLIFPDYILTGSVRHHGHLLFIQRKFSEIVLILDDKLLVEIF